MPSLNRAGKSFASGLALALALLLAACGTPQRSRGVGRLHAVSDTPVKVGPPYQAGGRTWVPADTRSYDVTGIASWYGDAHRGRPTANGERFDPDRISAAHPTLPLPSYVTVTLLATGRTIIVRINDRGPFVAGRIIELSRGAARLLGLDREGVARVRVRRVYPAEADRAALRAGRPAIARHAVEVAVMPTLRAPAKREPATPLALPAMPLPPVIAPLSSPQAPTVAARSTASGSLYVQLDTTDDADRADGLASAAGAIGPAAVVARGDVWVARLGPFADEAIARSVLARALASGYQNARLVRESAP